MKLENRYQLSEKFNLEEYDKFMEKYPLEQRIIIDFIIERYNKNKKLKVVEFGAGTGRFTKSLLSKFPKMNITLVEPDKNCCMKLNKLKQKYKQVKIIQSSAEKFKSIHKFDIAVMTTAFHHIPFTSKNKFLNMIKNILKREGMFLCTDNFIAEYKNMEEREIILRKSINRWIKEAKQIKDKLELKMAQGMKDLVFRKDFGGEYFICPSKFEDYIKKAGLKIKGKVNVTNTCPLDMENYFYLIMRK